MYMCDWSCFIFCVNNFCFHCINVNGLNLTVNWTFSIWCYNRRPLQLGKKYGIHLTQPQWFQYNSKHWILFELCFWIKPILPMEFSYLPCLTINVFSSAKKKNPTKQHVSSSRSKNLSAKSIILYDRS